MNKDKTTAPRDAAGEHDVTPNRTKALRALNQDGAFGLQKWVDWATDFDALRGGNPVVARVDLPATLAEQDAVGKIVQALLRKEPHRPLTEDAATLRLPPGERHSKPGYWPSTILQPMRKQGLDGGSVSPEKALAFRDSVLLGNEGRDEWFSDEWVANTFGTYFLMEGLGGHRDPVLVACLRRAIEEQRERQAREGTSWGNGRVADVQWGEVQKLFWRTHEATLAEGSMANWELRGDWLDHIPRWWPACFSGEVSDRDFGWLAALARAWYVMTFRCWPCTATPGEPSSIRAATWEASKASALHAVDWSTGHDWEVGA